MAGVNVYGCGCVQHDDLPRCTVHGNPLLSDLAKPSNPPLETPNPKDAIGCKKTPYGMVPASAIAYQALAHLHGHLKYGRYNWRVAGVRASIYFDAAMRHFNAWFNGEDTDPESNLPHLSHAACCINIIMDAMVCGKLTDDRPTPAPVAELQRDLDKLVATMVAGKPHA